MIFSAYLTNWISLTGGCIDFQNLQMSNYPRVMHSWGSSGNEANTLMFVCNIGALQYLFAI